MDRTRRQTLTLITQEEQQPGYLLNLGLATGTPIRNTPTAIRRQAGTKDSGRASEQSRSRESDRSFSASKGKYHDRRGGRYHRSRARRACSINIWVALPDHFDPGYAKIPDLTDRRGYPAGADPDFDIPQTMVAFLAGRVSSPAAIRITAPGMLMNQILGGGGNLSSLAGHRDSWRRSAAWPISVSTMPRPDGACGELAGRVRHARRESRRRGRHPLRQDA